MADVSCDGQNWELFAIIFARRIVSCFLCKIARPANNQAKYQAVEQTVRCSILTKPDPSRLPYIT